MKRLLLMTLMGTTVVGCASDNQSDIDISDQQPAELVDLDEERTVKERWRLDLGKGIGDELLQLKPAVDGDSVYAVSADGVVRKLKLKNGQTIWSKQTKELLSAGPALGDGLVVSGSREGKVIALGAADGKQRWTASVDGEILATPAVKNGVVVIRTMDGRAIGLSSVDGSRIWVHDESMPKLTLRGQSEPVIIGGSAIIGFDTGRVRALNLVSGRENWNVTVATPKGSTDIERLVDIDGNMLMNDEGTTMYVSAYQGNVAALAGGSVRWKTKMSSYSGLAKDGVQLYVSDQASHVWALDLTTGEAVWENKRLHERKLTGPAVMNGSVFVGDKSGYLHRLSVADGKLQDRIKIDSSGLAVSPVATSSGTLLVQSNSGTLKALTIR